MPTIIPELDGWHSKRRPSSRRVMIPSAATARANGWDHGNPWVDSDKWMRPRKIRLVSAGSVHMSQMFRGKLSCMAPVRAFPSDVHRVEITCNEAHRGKQK